MFYAAAEVQRCPNCYIADLSNYYTCYNFAVHLNDQLCFDYQLPYPLGKGHFPKITKLPKIEQMPNEAGPYLFGHEANDGELNYVLQSNLLQEIKQWVSTQPWLLTEVWKHVCHDESLW